MLTITEFSAIVARREKNWAGPDNVPRVESALGRRTPKSVNELRISSNLS